jgi:hypothetical protein
MVTPAVGRPGQKSGVRTEFTVFANVIPGHERAIRATIESSFADPRREQALRELGTLHEARHVLFDGDTRYVFASSFDGEWDKYIDDFAGSYSGVVLDSVLHHCQGYPGLQDPGVKDWISSHQAEAIAFASAYPEAPVRQIWKALEIQRAFDAVLDDPAAEDALAAPAMKPLLDLAAT